MKVLADLRLCLLFWHFTASAHADMYFVAICKHRLYSVFSVKVNSWCLRFHVNTCWTTVAILLPTLSIVNQFQNIGYFHCKVGSAKPVNNSDTRYPVASSLLQRPSLSRRSSFKSAEFVGRSALRLARRTPPIPLHHREPTRSSRPPAAARVHVGPVLLRIGHYSVSAALGSSPL